MGGRGTITPSVVKDGHMQTYPYTPLQLLLTVPGYLLGDVRWAGRRAGWHRRANRG